MKVPLLSASVLATCLAALVGCTPPGQPGERDRPCFARGPLELELVKLSDVAKGPGCPVTIWLTRSQDEHGAPDRLAETRPTTPAVADIQLALLFRNVSRCPILLDRELVLASCSFGLWLYEIPESGEFGAADSGVASDIPSDGPRLRVVPRLSPANPGVGDVITLPAGETLGVRFTLREAVGLAPGVTWGGRLYLVGCSYKMERWGRWMYYSRTRPEMWVGVAESDAVLLP